MPKLFPKFPYSIDLQFSRLIPGEQAFSLVRHETAWRSEWAWRVWHWVLFVEREKVVRP